MASVQAVESAAPRYELLKPLYADDVLWGEGEIIEYDGTPNEAMVPLNQAAEDRMRAFLDSLPGGRTRPIEEIVADAMRNRPQFAAGPQAAPGSQRPMPTKETAVPQMSNVQEPGARQRGRPQKAVNHIERPPEAKYRRPIKAMGTVVNEVPGRGSE